MAVTPVISRRIPQRWRKQSKALARTIGEITLSANRLQTAFSGLFWLLLTPDEEEFINIDIANAVWNVIQSDSTQREMVMAEADAYFRPNARILTKIRWAKRKADALGVIRNDAAHLSVWIDPRDEKAELAPSPFGIPSARIGRFKAHKNIKDRFRHVSGDFNQLAEYVFALGQELRALPGSGPWPKRPRLRSIQG